MNMPEDALQYLFDKSLNHIRKQKQPAIRGSGRCSYMTPNGLSCGAAPFIIEYEPEMEDNSWTVLCEKYDRSGKLDDVATYYRNFVQSLQSAHDSSAKNEGAFMFYYEERMRFIAHTHGLKYENP